MKRFQKPSLPLLLMIVSAAVAHAAPDPFAPTTKPVIAPRPAVPVGSVPKTTLPSKSLMLPQQVKTQISGTLRLTDCGARPGEVSFLLNGMRRSARIGSHPGDEFAYQYVIDDVAIGRHALAVQLPAGRCPGGGWQPASRTVTVRPLAAVSGQDFHYRGLRQVRRIGTFVIAGLIESAFAGTEVRLNNYGGRPSRLSWHRPNDSLVRLGSGLGGAVQRFNIPEASSSPWRYYVNDLNLRRVTVRGLASGFRLNFQFESEGTEIKGRCAGNGAERLLCAVGSDDSAPDFQIDRAQLQILLPPVRHGRDISFGEAEVEFSAAIDGSGVGELVDTFVSRTLKVEVESNLSRALNRASVRDRIAAALRPSLNGFGIGSVASVRIEGPDLVVEHISD